MWQAAEKFRFEENAASGRGAGSKGKCSKQQERREQGEMQQVAGHLEF